jgi:DNA-binding transcriptional ArsR family regulator
MMSRKLDEGLDAEVLQDVAATFAMLATPVRVHLLWLLSEEGRDVGTLAEQTGQSLATVSHHLGKLKLAGLVKDQRDGKRRIYVIDDPHVTELVHAGVDKRLNEIAAARPRRRRA